VVAGSAVALPFLSEKAIQCLSRYECSTTPHPTFPFYIRLTLHSTADRLLEHIVLARITLCPLFFQSRFSDVESQNFKGKGCRITAKALLGYFFANVADNRSRFATGAYSLVCSPSHAHHPSLNTTLIRSSLQRCCVWSGATSGSVLDSMDMPRLRFGAESSRYVFEATVGLCTLIYSSTYVLQKEVWIQEAVSCTSRPLEVRCRS
jgi:hypothetical protein